MIDLILDGLYICDAASVIHIDGRNKMIELNINKVLTSSSMPINENARLPNVEYKFLFMMDIASQDILGNGILQDAIKFIDETINNNQNILVHCEYGISRSVALVAGYLMKRFKWCVNKSIMFIQKARPIASPNSSFVQQLKIFEHIGYCLEPQILLTSLVYKNYCADTGKIPASVSSQNKSSLNHDLLNEIQTGSKNHSLADCVHSLADCARFSQQSFRCRRCRTELFYDLHLMHHTIGGLQNKSKSNNFENSNDLLLDNSTFNDQINSNESINITNENNFSNCSDISIKKEKNNNKGSIENLLLKRQCYFEYLITPMKWMDLSNYQGKICCPKCKEKLGQYIWGGRICSNENNGGYEGSCGAFVTPWIHIQKCKIDVSDIVKLDSSLNKLSLQNNNKTKFIVPSVIITRTSSIT